MTQTLSKTPVITPSRLGRYLEKKLADDRHLRLVGVQGEVSNFKPQQNGTLYFSLKDRDAVLNCVAFSERAAGFPAIENGVDAIAYGEVKIYAKMASLYQLVVTQLELTGVGALHARYEELRIKLDRAGLFDEARKRPLPRFPFRIALVGSPTGDGTNDFRTQARQRAPHVAIELISTAVNGPQAAPEIARAIARADATNADAIVVVRGGGSYEDLFGFSDDRVVRAIANARTPTVVAIGHERDVTLAELAADRAASTPSKAAQTVLPRRDDLRALVARTAADAQRALVLHLERARNRLDRIERRSPVADPSRLLGARRQTVDALRASLTRRAEQRIARHRSQLQPLDRRLLALSPHARLERRRARLERFAARLVQVRTTLLGGRATVVATLDRRIGEAAARAIARKRGELVRADGKLGGNNPEALLQRGYAIVRVGERVLRDPAAVPPGTHITAELARGTLYARVEGETVDGGEQIGLF
jgi:exodeoxyribonuclease VII large subunit